MRNRNNQVSSASPMGFLLARSLTAALLLLPFAASVSAGTFEASDVTKWLSREQLKEIALPDMPAPRFGAQIEKSIWVPMGDGVRLSVDLYLPANDQRRLPVILIRTPYDKRKWGLNEDGSGNAETAMFVGQGFAVAVQDTRGRYQSEGRHRVSADARSDGYDTLSWIAGQPWSNSRIGTYGCSYLGEVQYMLAAMNHPNHAAMIPQAGGGALGLRGRFFNFGINHGGAQELSTISWFLTGRGNWLKPQFPPDSTRAERIEMARFFEFRPQLPDRDLVELFQTLPLIDIGTRAGVPSGDLEDFISKPPGDDYWVRRGFLQESDQIAVPGLHVDSWYDKMIGATLHMMELAQSNTDPTVANNQYAVISPSTHCRSEELGADAIVGKRAMGDARLDHYGLYVDWFDYWLKGNDSGVSEWPHFRSFLMGANEWRAHDQWPIPTVRQVHFYLHSGGQANSSEGDGALSQQAPGDQPPDQFTYDPADPVPSLGGSFCCIGTEIPPAGSYDHSEIERRNDVLVYTSSPLERGMEVTGRMNAVLYVSSSARDTDFFVKILDVHPDGSAWNLKEGVLRARYRNGFTRPKFMSDDEVYELHIPLHATSNYFARGHRIRIEVSSSSFPRIGRNLNTGGNNYDEAEGVVARNSIYHSHEYPSHVVLSVIPD